MYLLMSHHKKIQNIPKKIITKCVWGGPPISLSSIKIYYDNFKASR